MGLYLSLDMNGNKTEGVGAMMMYPIMLSFVSKFFDVGFSFSGIKELSHFEYTDHADNSESWSKSFEEFFNFPKLEKPDEIVNGFSFDQNLINFIEANRNTDKQILIEITQHGGTWPLICFCEQNSNIIFPKDLVQAAKNNLKFDRQKYFNENEINIALHIRTENPKDVDASSSERELYNFKKDFSRYLNLIDRLKKKYYNKKTVLHIYSQGFTNSFKEFVELATDLFEVKLHIDEHPISDLYHMIHSDCFIMANSAFSYIASFMRTNLTYVRDNFWCFTYPSAIKVDYNFNI
jgi:hypothetical protein